MAKNNTKAEKLKPDQNEVLALYLQGYSLKKISEHSGVPFQTVRSWIAKYNFKRLKAEQDKKLQAKILSDYNFSKQRNIVELYKIKEIAFNTVLNNSENLEVNQAIKNFIEVIKLLQAPEFRLETQTGTSPGVLAMQKLLNEFAEVQKALKASDALC